MHDAVLSTAFSTATSISASMQACGVPHRTGSSQPIIIDVRGLLET